MSRTQTSRTFENATPSDTEVLKDVRALYITADGDLALEDSSGSQVVIPVVSGQVLPFAATKILSTGTTTAAAVILY